MISTATLLVLLAILTVEVGWPEPGSFFYITTPRGLRSGAHCQSTANGSMAQSFVFIVD
jgi:hypothetical protein